MISFELETFKPIKTLFKYSISYFFESQCGSAIKGNIK